MNSLLHKMIVLFFVGLFILSIILNLVRIGRNIRAKKRPPKYEQSLEYKKFEKELNDMINQSYN